MKKIKYKPGIGFVMVTGSTDVECLLLGACPDLRQPGHVPRIGDCSFQDVRSVPELANGMLLYDKPIVHWEFPNFSTLDLKMSVLETMYVKGETDVITLGTDVFNEIGYITNKSDGEPYMMFSCRTDKWYSFAHFRSRIQFLGEGYRVGHVEVLKKLCVSTHYQGKIRINNEWIGVKRKPMWDQPDLQRGCKEGVIIELTGVEYRIKAELTHDLMLTLISDDSATVVTSDGSYTIRMRLPLCSVQVGQIVECAGGTIIRARPDKYSAETRETYERIENSIDYQSFQGRFRKFFRDVMVLPRRQLKKEPHLIADSKLFDAIQKTGSLLTLQNCFKQYCPRDIALTVRACGAVMESISYQVERKLNYNTYLEIYTELGKDFVPAQYDDTVDAKYLLNFEFDMLKKVVISQECMLRNDELSVVQLEHEDNLGDDYMFEAAVRVVEAVELGQLVTHSKSCQNQMLKYSTLKCNLCVYNQSVKYLIDRVTNSSGTILNNGEKLKLYRQRKGNSQKLIKRKMRKRMSRMERGLQKTGLEGNFLFELPVFNEDTEDYSQPRVKYKEEEFQELTSNGGRKTEAELLALMSMSPDERREKFGDEPEIYTHHGEMW